MNCSDSVRVELKYLGSQEEKNDLTRDSCGHINWAEEACKCVLYTSPALPGVKDGIMPKDKHSPVHSSHLQIFQGPTAEQLNVVTFAENVLMD
jgi:hypothetical protein